MTSKRPYFAPYCNATAGVAMTPSHDAMLSVATNARANCLAGDASA